MKQWRLIEYDGPPGWFDAMATRDLPDGTINMGTVDNPKTIKVTTLDYDPIKEMEVRGIQVSRSAIEYIDWEAGRR